MFSAWMKTTQLAPASAHALLGGKRQNDCRRALLRCSPIQACRDNDCHHSYAAGFIRIRAVCTERRLRLAIVTTTPNLIYHPMSICLRSSVTVYSATAAESRGVLRAIKATLEAATCLWIGGPVGELFEPLSHVLVFQNVERIEVDLLLLQQADQGTAEATPWSIGCAFHEHHRFRPTTYTNKTNKNKHKTQSKTNTRDTDRQRTDGYINRLMRLLCA